MELVRLEPSNAQALESAEGAEPSLRVAQAAGFHVLQQGQAVLRAAFDRLAAKASGAQAEPKKAFGQLFVKLSHDYADDPAFDLYRRILRNCILDVWPVAPGEVVLGEALPHRRLHSLRTAELETGVGAGVLGWLLVEAGAISPEDERPDSRRTFDAQVFAPLLAEVTTLVSPLAMRRAIGATKAGFAALVEDGVLQPRSQVAKLKNRWRVTDGLALVAELQAHAVPVEADTESWESLREARSRSGVGLDVLHDAIRAGDVAAGRRVGVEGYRSLVVRSANVDVLGHARTEVGRDDLALRGLVSAAAFGRSIGLRDHGCFLALTEAGHTPSTLVLRSRTGLQQRCMSKAEIASFHRRFMTTTTIAEETGLHRNTITTRLRLGGVALFSPGGQDFGPIYLRGEVEQVFPGELNPARA